MPPRSDDHLLVVLRLAQRDPVQTRAPQVGVSPAGEMVDGDVLVFSGVIDYVHADILTISVIVAMRHGLDEPVLIARNEAKCVMPGRSGNPFTYSRTCSQSAEHFCMSCQDTALSREVRLQSPVTPHMSAAEHDAVRPRKHVKIASEHDVIDFRLRQ